ncbi:MAG: translation initiation factor IF-3 [Patescibacteria group bacterium]|nr:translation initiation factor IF-3 [Patescibacteria group bacterium]
MKYTRTPFSEPRIRANERIRVPEVFLIDETGKPVGKTPTGQALALAKAAGLDLVEVSPNIRPPVAKILDFGKYKYEQTKAAAKAKKKQKDISKEIRLGVKIGDGDFEVKAKRAEKFLSQGAKLKVAVMFRGREIVHSDLGHKLMERFIDRLEGVAKIEQAPLKQGRSIHTILAPKK